MVFNFALDNLGDPKIEGMVVALAVGTVTIPLPSRLILELGDYYYVPSISRNIISVSYLALYDDVEFCIKGNCCSFSKGEMHYGAGTHSNGLYILDPKRPILNIEVKKAKKDDPKLSYIWYSRLGHINNTRLTKLHKQGYIDPFNYESYGKCECCLLGKMTKLPFTKKEYYALISSLRALHQTLIISEIYGEGMNYTEKLSKNPLTLLTIGWL
ncbi:GAG-pre-integrase domain - like 10 [Theobroma cacao]|nr:GAG-pre-integrase domain - like 10 [Theobroma cacao]